jgi:hypothetical protein
VKPTHRRTHRRRRRGRSRAAFASLGLGALLGGAVFVAVMALGDPASPPAAVAAAPQARATAETKAAAPPPAPSAARRTITIAATGDIALTPMPSGADGFFRDVAPALRGDLVLGNLEGTLATGGTSKCGANRGSHCFAFRAPPSYAGALRKAGFTMMNLANNHANDYGPQGLAETVAALGAAKLRHTGRPGQITVVRLRGVRVAVLGFAPYPWAQDLLDLAGVERLVREASKKADVVVVTMHAGAEGSDRARVRPGPETYLGEQRGNVVAFARTAVRAGADLVVGHGPHVLRGMEWYRGRLIAYSLGNFAGYHTFGVTGPLGVSGVLRVTLHEDGAWKEGELVATRLVGPGTPVRDPAEAAHGVVRKLSAADFGARAVRVSPTGKLRPPG